VLAAWDLIGPHVTHIDASGNSRDYVLPMLGWCGETFPFTNCYLNYPSPATSLILGDNNTAFATNTDKLVSFDVNTGATLWTRSAQQGHKFSLVAASAGGGLAAKDVDSGSQSGTYSENIVRFDASGNGAYDTSLGVSGIQYSWERDWFGINNARDQVETIANDPVNLAMSTWAFQKGTPAGNGKAERPWFFVLVFQNDFTFYPNYPQFIPSLQTDITFAAPIIKRAAVEAVQHAYHGFPVTVVEGTSGTGDHRAYVMTHQNIDPTSPDCGDTSPQQFPIETDSQVDYTRNMEEAQSALKLSIRNASDEAAALKRNDLFQAIGRGIGSVSAHEIAHHFLLLCCNMDANPNDDPGALATYNHGHVCSGTFDPSFWIGYYPSPRINLHWEAPEPFQSLTKCLNYGWRDSNYVKSCHN